MFLPKPSNSISQTSPKLCHKKSGLVFCWTPLKPLTHEKCHTSNGQYDLFKGLELGFKLYVAKIMSGVH